MKADRNKIVFISWSPDEGTLVYVRTPFPLLLGFPVGLSSLTLGLMNSHV